MHRYTYRLRTQPVTWYTYRLRTQRVTCWPLSRHFSGFGSFFLHLRNATFSLLHFAAICLDADINTADVGIGSPTTFTVLAISPPLTFPDHSNTIFFLINSIWFLRIQWKSQRCEKEKQIINKFFYFIFDTITRQ